jgi:hypothetical protein
LLHVAGLRQPEHFQHQAADLALLGDFLHAGFFIAPGIIPAPSIGARYFQIGSMESSPSTNRESFSQGTVCSLLPRVANRHIRPEGLIGEGAVVVVHPSHRFLMAL